MIKVSGGGRSVAAVLAHFRYIGRHGRVSLLSDDGQELTARNLRGQLADWSLDEVSARDAEPYAGVTGSTARKLVHNLVFSMPKGTPPEALLGAVRDFARENFGLSRRYAMALHTDQEHPHVHLVVMARDLVGARLNIRKLTLREWRQQFAKALGKRGVVAVASQRAPAKSTLREKSNP